MGLEMNWKLPPDEAVAMKVIYEALQGDNEDQRRIAEVGLNWLQTLLRKNADYGSAVWQEGNLARNIPVGAKILVRMDDKIDRLTKLLSGGQAMVVEETLEETIKDLGAYCLLYLARPKTEVDSLRKAWKENRVVIDNENDVMSTPVEKLVPIHDPNYIPKITPPSGTFLFQCPRCSKNFRAPGGRQVTMCDECEKAATMIDPEFKGI